MAFTPTDDFESYSVGGDLNGGSGGSDWSAAWSGSTAFDIQNTVVAEGTQAVIENAQSGEPSIGRTFSGITDGVCHSSIRRSVTDKDVMDTWLSEGGIAEGNRVCGIDFDSAGNILQMGATNTAIDTYSANTWYAIDVEFDCSTDQFRVSIDEGTYSSWFDFRTSETTLTGMIFRKGADGNTSTNYWDDIRNGASSNGESVNPIIRYAPQGGAGAGGAMGI